MDKQFAQTSLTGSVCGISAPKCSPEKLPEIHEVHHALEQARDNAIGIENRLANLLGRLGRSVGSDPKNAPDAPPRDGHFGRFADLCGDLSVTLERSHTMLDRLEELL